MSQGEPEQAKPLEQSPLRRVVIIFGQTSTHTLQKMIADVLGKPPIDIGLRDPDTLADILDRAGHERLIFENFVFDRHARVLDPARYPDLRLVLIHRHPLDQFVADVWHQMKVSSGGKIPIPDPTASPHDNARGLLLGNYDDTLGERYEDLFKSDMRRKVLDWMDSSRALEVRYEDFIERPEEQLIRCLNHLEIRFKPAAIPEIVAKHRIETDLGNKANETDNDTLCRRKAIPGEWRKVFSPEDLRPLQFKYGGIVQRQGYAIERFDQVPLCRVLVSYGRSGTHWLKNLISGVLQRPPVEGGAWDVETLAAILQGSGRRRLVYEHFRFDLHGELLDPAKNPELRLVLLHRHPLDQFISATWHRINITGEMTNFDPQSHPNDIARGLLLGHYDERLGYKYRDAYIETHKRNLLDWIESGRCLQIKYEDLVENTEAELTRCLNALEVRFDKGDVMPVVERNRFEKLSGGRKPGQVDGKHHYRRGAPGEWRSVFKPEDLPILQDRYGDVFTRQGYPI
jgi:hypothetical protein